MENCFSCQAIVPLGHPLASACFQLIWQASKYHVNQLINYCKLQP